MDNLLNVLGDLSNDSFKTWSRFMNRIEDRYLFFVFHMNLINDFYEKYNRIPSATSELIFERVLAEWYRYNIKSPYDDEYIQDEWKKTRASIENLNR